MHAYQQHYGQYPNQNMYGYHGSGFQNPILSHPQSLNADQNSQNPKSIDQSKTKMIPKANSVSDVLTLNTRGAINSSMIKGIYFSEIGAESRHFSDDTQILNSLGQPVIPAKRFVARRREYDTTSLAPDAVKKVDRVFKQEESEFNEDSISQFVNKQE